MKASYGKSRYSHMTVKRCCGRDPNPRGIARMKRIVILGAGTAGTIMANRLSRRYGGDPDAPDVSITVVDQDDEHVYQPGLLFVPFGTYRSEERRVGKECDS